MVDLVREKWQLVRYIIAASIGFFMLLLVVYGWNEDGLRCQIRWSARISFSLFCCAFGASALHYLLKSKLTTWLQINRKFIGVSFALIHLIHLIFLILLQYVYHPVFDLAATTSLIGGGVAYLFVVTMLLTSFEMGRQLLTNGQWKFLHTIGGYWIWSIFMTTYFKRTETEPIYWLFVGILLMIFVMRAVKISITYQARTGL